LYTLKQPSKEKLRDINSYALVVLAFFMPLSVAIPNIISLFILLVWLFIGTFKDDWNQLKNNKVVLAILVYILVHFIGLLWTNNFEYGLEIVQKNSRLLLIPFFMLFVKKEHIPYYLYAFILAITISEIVSYLIFFDVIAPFKHASSMFPTPFMGHLSYNPYLTIAIYILLFHVFLSDTIIKKKHILLYGLFIATMSINMFITGGRAGQIMFFAMLVIVIFQIFQKQIFKATVISLIIISSVFTIAYYNSELFKDRMNLIVTEITDYNNNKNTSVGLRLSFTLNSLHVIQENGFFGTGTGGFRDAYSEVNKKLSPEIEDPKHPHNMYILELVELGIIGLFSLIAILFFQIKHAYYSKDILVKNMGIALPLLFALILLSDTYLSGPRTTMLFIFFSAILYKHYAKADFSNDKQN